MKQCEFKFEGMDELKERELSLEESEMISGGESLWYWISYGVGALIGGSNNGYQTAGQRAYNSAFS